MHTVSIMHTYPLYGILRKKDFPALEGGFLWLVKKGREGLGERGDRIKTKGEGTRCKLVAFFYFIFLGGYSWLVRWD